MKFGFIRHYLYVHDVGMCPVTLKHSASAVTTLPSYDWWCANSEQIV